MTAPYARLATALADRYTIERELGAGGMATVYLAHDVKHDRPVALKVLRPELAAVIGAERFLNEIKVTANLQHPHILPLHDSGEADGFLFYVMPYVEGESLRERLKRERQLPISEAVELTRAVASALDYAHRHNVIHRDIKPENILIHDGQPTVADFGIALAVSHAGGTRLTETGLSVGTPHYMSPEQAMGERELDARSDVYSLGAMLYEMLVGEPPFTGPSAQAIVAKVITEKPPSVMAARDTVPPHVSAAVNRALAKLPADRYPTAAAFAEALARPSLRDTEGYETLTATGVAPAAPAPRTWRRWLPWGVVGVIAVAAAVGWLRSPPHVPTQRYRVVLPNMRGGGVGPDIAVSPRGNLLAYRALAATELRLVVRRRDRLDVTALPEQAVAFSFSPDERSIAYWWGALKRVAVDGGPPITLTDSAAPSMDWGLDGYIYFTLSNFGLARIPEDGGPIERLTSVDTTLRVAHFWPQRLPVGNGVLYTMGTTSSDQSNIAVFDLASRQSAVLTRGVYARYLPTGDLLFLRNDGAVMLAPFDAKALKLTGPATPVLEHVAVNVYGAPELAVANDGTVLFAAGVEQTHLALVGRGGGVVPLPPSTAGATTPRVSPNGRRLVMTQPSSAGNDLWVLNLDDSTHTRITFEGDVEYPSWSHDGRSVFYAALHAGSPTERDFNRAPADASAPAELLFAREGSQEEIVESSDGRWLVYREGDRARNQNAQLYYVAAKGEGEHHPFLTGPYNERSPALSPDGKWLAYVSDESGRDEVYVRPFPTGSGRWQVSIGGGTEPVWARSGRELFYRSAGDLIAAALTTTAGVSIRGRRTLFSTTGYEENANHAAYDVLPGDSLFVFMQTGAGTQELTLILNWFEELRKK